MNIILALWTCYTEAENCADAEKQKGLDFRANLSPNPIRCLTANALLRCEQRNTNAAAYHLNHLNQRIVKMPR
ncbi:hypothetical protein BBM00_09615, partial [Vibrio parahaemolyticus]|uniref:hypothetical protein n=1 Tax=Vibrio parahaemolyticus TaxID=670 RepID=UPI00084B9445